MVFWLCARVAVERCRSWEGGGGTPGGQQAATATGELGGGPVNLAGVRSAQPVPASPWPPRAAQARGRARPAHDAGVQHLPACGHASAPPTATRQ